MDEFNKSNLQTNDSLLGLTESQLAEMLAPMGEPSYRGKQIYKWIHHRNANFFEEMSNLPKFLRERLSEKFNIKTLRLENKQISVDGTEKYVWRLSDNRTVESVLIPEDRRTTVCISSQVGCSLGCEFCSTGSMGFIRNLSPGEIVEQVLQIRQLSNYSITNVVFMGMGEPFLNYGRVIQACRILGDPEGLAIANKRITVSTSGVVPKIYQFAHDDLPFSLAVSLHAPTQPLREKIMPIAKKFPLSDLMESIRYYMRSKKRNRVTFEYVLLHEVNDSANEAKQLIRLLSPFRCKLNLIPCNYNDMGYHPPPSDQMNNFASKMRDAPFAVTVRKNRGEDIKGACGQLAVDLQEKAIFMR